MIYYKRKVRRLVAELARLRGASTQSLCPFINCMRITVGDRSRLEIESAAAHDIASTQKARADKAATDAERAQQRAITPMHRESEYL